MSQPLTHTGLRRMAITGSLTGPTTIDRAIRALGFVQADPIRAPARAQDLILRHRVAGYRAGDLQRRFTRLGLEEDFLYAYGIMPRDTWRLLHPRHDADSSDGRHVPAGLAAEVLAFVRDRDVTHPRDLAARFGRERALNGWGSWSAATTRALHSLHYYGLLRVARRQDGIRIYAPAPPHAEPLSRDERTRRVVLLVTRILAPLPERSLRATCSLLSRGVPDLGDPADAVRTLLAAGELESGEVDGERYLWPPGMRAPEAPRMVRFLAPFDPLVWDRRRFTLLWDWDYRFEAYTPPADRRFGYYAMPLLWGEHVIGWANAIITNGAVDLVPGFIGAAPKGRDFRRALDAEIARLATFLQPR
ncbi:MAG TPA: crosslink repair DNA glycosylase YcaQ family protein [Acetobacteraceae bacterium]|nr:crosslink repair DNA glycosylase YcaQ family protein [Acetobacteraceae bacterium]